MSSEAIAIAYDPTGWITQIKALEAKLAKNMRSAFDVLFKTYPHLASITLRWNGFDNEVIQIKDRADTHNETACCDVLNEHSREIITAIATGKDITAHMPYVCRGAKRAILLFRRRRDGTVSLDTLVV